MFRTLAFTAVVAVAVAATPALAASAVDGTWATAIDVQGTKIESEITFAPAPSGYSIAIKDGPMPGAPADAPPMESTISDVKVDGASFSFSRQLTTPQGPMKLTYTGSVEGNALTGQINSDFGPIAMTGTRK